MKNNRIINLHAHDNGLGVIKYDFKDKVFKCDKCNLLQEIDKVNIILKLDHGTIEDYQICKNCKETF